MPGVRGVESASGWKRVQRDRAVRARSLEAIVEMSALTGRPRYERASLPPRQQLAPHVDARQFLEPVRG
jgi:hypothetical protein